MSETIEFPDTTVFWDKVDAIHDEVVEDVRKNCEHVKYQCCEDASWKLFKMLKSYFVEAFGSIEAFEERTNMILNVAYGGVQGVAHVWVMIGGFVQDPTEIQFTNKPHVDDYDIGLTENERYSL